MKIDHSLHPDLDDPPNDLPDNFAKPDYLHRVCTVWDFGIMPDSETFELLEGWREDSDPCEGFV